MQSHPNHTLYFILSDGKQAGPYTIGQLRSMWQSGIITTETQYYFEGAPNWQPMIKLRSMLEPNSVVKNRPASIITRPPRVPAPPSTAAASSQVGVFLMLAGFAISAYFFFVYDTSVRVESRYVTGFGSVGGGRVNNLGLMQNRQLGCIGGLVLTVAGLALTFGKGNRPPR